MLISDSEESNLKVLHLARLCLGTLHEPEMIDIP
jgi:hypothetical protein